MVEAAFRERALTSLTPRLSEKMALLESTAMDKIQTKHTALKARHETLRCDAVAIRVSWVAQLKLSNNTSRVSVGCCI